MEFRNDCDVYRDRSVRASWKVPAFCCNDWGALKLLEICSAFGFERPFDLVYGAPHCSWSGGRPSAVRSPLDGGLIDAYFSAYAQFGVRCALTFSKIAVDEKDYDNEYNNMLLDYVEKYDGQVILFDDGLARYIKRSRPRIAIVASLNKAMCNLQDSRESESDYYRDLFRLYDEVVVRSEYVLRDGWLDDLRDRRDSVEIIVNQFCVPDCKHAFSHISELEEWSHRGCCGEGRPCYHLETASCIESRLSENLFISNRRISELCSAGFTHMKIAGRNSPLPLFLDTLAEYIFEPTGVISHIKRAIVRDFKKESMMGFEALFPFSIPKSVLKGL